MWNSPVCLSFSIISYCSVQVVSSFKISEIGPNFNPAKAYNVSSAELNKLLDNARRMIDSSGEVERETLIHEEEEKEREEKEREVKERDEKVKMTRRANVPKKRVKRNSGGGGVGKFATAAKVDNLKTLRIYLTLFKNLWAKSYVGGAHPFHKDVPKPVIILFKHRIMEFFFPPVGDDAIKT